MALHCQAVGRLLVAETLWPEVSEHRAYAALRSALARLDRASRQTLQVTASSLELTQGVAVDLTAAATASLSLDLLPFWYDDWSLLEAEDWHQLRLHALEALVSDLTAARCYGDVTAAGAAIRADPLRESAQAALIRVHLAQGNQSEALRAFDRFSHLLQADLGLAPTPQLHELVADLLQASHHRDGPGLSSEHAHPAHRPPDHPGAL